MGMQTIMMLAGLIGILFGYLRLVWLNMRDVNNVSLTSWAFTGGLSQFLTGFINGIIALMARRPDANSLAALFVLCGVCILWIAW